MDIKYSINKIISGTVNNCTYIIINKSLNKAIIIDPAWDIEKITTIINKNKVSLAFILLTHSHYDHTNLVNSLTKIYNCKVYISRIEANNYGYKCENICHLDDCDEIWFGDISIKCFLTPGHTRGSMCFKIEDNLFTGDTIFIRGCGMCNCKGGSYDDMFKSIQKIKEILKDNIKIYPGHYIKNDEKYENDILKNNIYFRINNKINFEKIMCLSEKGNEIYKRYEK